VQIQGSIDDRYSRLSIYFDPPDLSLAQSLYPYPDFLNLFPSASSHETHHGFYYQTMALSQ
jgi:hypothetical protein